MAVTIESQTWTPAGWTITWSSDLGSPPADGYRVFVNGALVASGNMESWTVKLQAGEALVFEVLDDPDQVPQTAFPGRLTLGWRRVSTAEHYRVEEYVDDAWTEVATVTDDGSEWRNWQTRYLEDGETHHFRVVPVHTNGNDGTALNVAVLMVRHPDAPITNDEVDDTFSYSNSTKKVTVAA